MQRTREAVVVAVIYDGDVPDTGFDWRMNFVGKRVADDHSFCATNLSHSSVYHSISGRNNIKIGKCTAEGSVMPV